LASSIGEGNLRAFLGSNLSLPKTNIRNEHVYVFV